jgi:TatD DNase family protein
MLELCDIGVNLTHKSFRADMEQVLARARSAGVTRMVVTGTSLDGSEDALELARKHGLRSTAGVHPHEAKTLDAHRLAQLRRLVLEPEVVAVGECGLDYDRNFSPPEAQRRAFEAQLELACESKKPVFLHERAAHTDFARILAEYRPRLSHAVVHCFTGSDEELDAYLALDLHVGITGWICDERRGTHLRSLVKRIPAHRLMIETDAPFLLPRTLRPAPRTRRNEPSFLPAVVDVVAESVGRTREAVAAETTQVAKDFFKLL